MAFFIPTIISVRDLLLLFILEAMGLASLAAGFLSQA
jgi:hypothetical protein